MRSCLLAGSLLFSLGGRGCARPPSPVPPSPVPPADQVTRVRIAVTQFPAGAGRKAPCEFALTEAPDVAEVVDWLKGIDWSQEGTDLAVVRLIQPDGEIVLTTRDSAALELGFYWDGRVVHRRANRLLVGGDGARLREIIEKRCK